MPQVADIVLADGQGTPVNHTFKPMRLASAVNAFRFEDRASGIKAGYPTITVEARSNTNNADKFDIVLKVPKLAQTAPNSGTGIQPNPTAAYSELIRITVTRPHALEPAVAADAYAYLKNLTTNTQFIAWIRDGDFPW